MGEKKQSDKVDSKQLKAESGFVHLHVHTHYSLLDGMCKIPQLLDKAVGYGMQAVAITDHGVMYGAIEFYKEAKKRGIKPIIGCETYIAPRTLTDKTPRVDTYPGHLVLLAKNIEGYQNLIKLITMAHLEGYYYKPRIDKEVLSKHSKGLIALSGCAKGEIGKNLREKNYKNAKKAALEYAEIFEKGDFYLEMQVIQKEWPEQKIINEGMAKISKETGIPVVATSDVHYVDKEDHDAHDILLCVQTGSFSDQENRMKMDGDWSFLSTEEMVKAFADFPEAIENTHKIAEKCTFADEYKLPFAEEGKILIPHFEVPKGQTKKSLLEKWVAKGLTERYKKITKEIKDRVAYELEVIERMGYEEYFLVVADFVNWAKNQEILVGPGRGSAAGSLVSYALNITELDPLKYDLLFERFLNPDRISMPDIDMDFADDRRHEVIQYVVDKYGKEKVAQIITFGTMMARNAVRDTGRVLGMPYAEVDEVAKVIPMNKHLSDSIKDVPELAAFYRQGGNYKKLLDLAQRLEGVARHSSTHAAGVVISREDLTLYTPLQKAIKGDIATNTQYEMHALEDLGLLKMDFLGLSNLTVLKNALRIINKVYGKEIDLSKLTLDDPETYKLLSRGETTGVFQLESAGMKRYIKELRPTVFEDITAMVALYRPGPMQWISEFIDRKNGRKEITYLHPSMKNALKNTYGIIVYQEQVMQISKDMCGFTGGQADTLRKAMGKKIAELMKKMRKEFVDGAVNNDVGDKLANQIFDSLEDFAQYAFNKSHAACYALISYWTAYLKAHFPDAFMAALLTSDYSDTDRIAIEVAECQVMGIEVLGPDINESFAEFGVSKGERKIRYGLSAIKNVGTGIVEAILDAREKEGKFKSIEDFATRVKVEEINKKVVEALIKCGAFDSIDDRSKLLFNLEKILGFAGKVQKGTANGQMGLFGEKQNDAGGSFSLGLTEPAEELTSDEKLAFEKELLGIYFSEHPLDQHEERLGNLDLDQIGSLSQDHAGTDVRIGGVITQIHKILTRKNEPMVFAQFEDKTGTTELIIFPTILTKYNSLIREGAVLYVKGKINNKDNQLKILVDVVEDLKTKEGHTKEVSTNFVQMDGAAQITIPEEATEGDLNILKLILSKNKGQTETYVLLPNGEGPKKVKMPFGIDFSDELVSEINVLLSRRL